MQPGEPEQQTAQATRPCDACGAAMAAGQDWCLECGTAAPGRLGARPGMRAAATVVSLTLALVGGAVAASYAALSDDSQQAANAPAPPSGDPVAQAPPGTIQSPAPSDALPPVTPPAGATTTPTIPTIPSTTTPTVPKIPSIPNFPTQTPSTSSPTVTVPKVTTPTTTTPSTDNDGDSDSNSGDGDTTTTPKTTTTPERQDPQPISLAADAASAYDPSKRATAKGDPKLAIDDKPSTSWTVSTADGSKDMATGIVIDLKSKVGVRVIEIATSTPGFRAEIYAADSDELPPDILDTRWAHITDRSKVDQQSSKDRNKAGDGKERIVLGGGSAKYRYVLLWVTTPPSGGPTVKVSELDLLK